MAPGFFCVVHSFETDIDELCCMSKLLKCIAVIKDDLPPHVYSETEKHILLYFLTHWIPQIFMEQ